MRIRSALYRLSVDLVEKPGFKRRSGEKGEKRLLLVLEARQKVWSKIGVQRLLIGRGTRLQKILSSSRNLFLLLVEEYNDPQISSIHVWNSQVFSSAGITPR